MAVGSLRRSAHLGAAACVLLLAGCGGTQDDAAVSAAAALLSAVERGDGGAACDLLAPPVRSELEQSTGKPCEQAVLEEDLGAATARPTVEVFETMAQAVVGTETLFLSRFDGRWLVVAAACKPTPGDRPYDCSIAMP